MRYTNVGADYDRALGRSPHSGSDNGSARDPARAARLIFEVVGADDPRSGYCAERAPFAQSLDSATARASELEQWADLSATAELSARSRQSLAVGARSNRSASHRQH